MKPFRGKTRAVEVHPGKPIHLGIKKTWASVEVCPAKIKARSFLIRVYPDDFPMLNDDVYDRLCPWNFPLNDHLNFESSIHNDNCPPWMIIPR